MEKIKFGDNSYGDIAIQYFEGAQVLYNAGKYNQCVMLAQNYIIFLRSIF